MKESSLMFTPDVECNSISIHNGTKDLRITFHADSDRIEYLHIAVTRLFPQEHNMPSLNSLQMANWNHLLMYSIISLNEDSPMFQFNKPWFWPWGYIIYYWGKGFMFCRSICFSVSQLRECYRDEMKLIHFESPVPLRQISQILFYFLIESLWALFCWHSSLCLVSSSSWV